MKFVNRFTVTLKPRDAFVQWAESVCSETSEDWSVEGGCYLFDEQESESALKALIAKEADRLLENELSVWSEDRAIWPLPLNAQTLESLFTLHISMATFDLAREPMMMAEIPEVV